MHDSGDTDQATSFLGLGLAGDRQLALSQVPLAKALNRKLRGFLATSGAKVFNLTQRFDGGYVQVSSYNGIERAFIYAEPATPLEIDELPNAQILSGVIKDADLVVTLGPLEEEVLTLRGFKPTDQTWKAIFKKDPAKPTTSFNDEPRLAVKISDEIHYLGEHLDPDTTVPFPEKAAQYKEICSSMYSGLMAKAVQVILGYGKLQSPTASEAHRVDGVQVKYDWRWARCHGIVRGAGNALWLVEISVTNGVLAMPLPMFKNTVVGTPGYQSLIKSKQDVLRETALLFGGLPSGGTFPTGTELDDALASGDVIRLATAAHMGAFFDKSHYSSWMGWSFNLGGTGVTPQAHNTCFADAGSGAGYVRTGYHYKLVFNIGSKTKNRRPDEPIAAGNATLSLVGSDRLVWWGSELMYVHDGDGHLAYTEPYPSTTTERVYFSPFPLQKVAAVLPSGNAKTVLIACHSGNEFDPIYLQRFKDEFTAELTTSGSPVGSAYFGSGPSEITSVLSVTNGPVGSCSPSISPYADGTSSGSSTYSVIGPNDSYLIRSDRCAPVADVEQLTSAAEASVTSASGTVVAGYWNTSGQIVSFESVVGWSGFCRDGYIISEQQQTNWTFTATVGGASIWEHTYSGDPTMRVITPRNPPSGDKVNDLRIVMPTTEKRRLGGRAFRPTFAYLPDTSVTVGDVESIETYGQVLYPIVKCSMFGKRDHIIASVPSDARFYTSVGATMYDYNNGADEDVLEAGSQTDASSLKGAMLLGETIESVKQYSFIGYI